MLLELPVILETRGGCELFAGPSLAQIELGNVSTPGPDGLAVELGTSSPTLGFHLGGRMAPGFGRWSIGVVARWLRPEVTLRVTKPVGSRVLSLATVESTEDLITVSLVVGRRLGV